jgi:hypothetical protein
MAQWEVGQEVGQTSRFNTVRKGVVTKVTPTGRATVALQNADGHKFEETFDSVGGPYPKRFMYMDGILTAWTVQHEAVWREQVASENRSKRRHAALRRKETEEAELDATAMRFTIGLLKKSISPVAARAIAVLNKHGYTE